MAKQVEDQIKKVIGSILNIDANKVADDASPDNLDNWDSLAHMNIIITLEERLKVRFTDDQIVKMLNYKLMVIMVKEALSSACESDK